MAGRGRLAVWAEDSTRPTQVPRRPGRAPRERPHPFAAEPAALSALLGDRPAGTVLLTLPTRAGAPLHSPELVPATVGEPVRGPVTLAGWRTPALRYAPDDAFDLLRTLDGLDAVVGAGLRHLAELAGFAADLVSRGRLLPGVADRPPGHVPRSPAGRRAGGRSVRSAGSAVGWAVWRPLLTGADAAWARSLALALPPAVRAAVDIPATTSRSRPAGAGRPGGEPAPTRCRPVLVPPTPVPGSVPTGSVGWSPRCWTCSPMPPPAGCWPTPTWSGVAGATA